MLNEKQQVIADLMALDWLFDKESKWTKHALARTKMDEILYDALSPRAYSYCLIGGIKSITYNGKERSRIDRLSSELKQEYHVSLSEWNDRSTTTFSDVKSLIKKTLLRLTK